ncbi:hypothetical protein K457DRAFT_21144 [Linnemannia elongata AG-77]|uniref:Anaphase-promoting complex subunit CDC26 n=1 Tax=Linnemannia elongata AG-77 TaxID=1314771 RepID=A0A197JTE4_9FUNG|nr:hypothetical protein K457DRAFT_21144 [Linnemannia elongata AG-77]
MLRRDPTRIELRAEDLLDFDRAREEYLDATGANNTSKNKHKATTAVPPPTPANQTTTTAGRKPDPFELAERERKGKDSTMETAHVSLTVLGQTLKRPSNSSHFALCSHPPRP